MGKNRLITKGSMKQLKSKANHRGTSTNKMLLSWAVMKIKRWMINKFQIIALLFRKKKNFQMIGSFNKKLTL